MSSNDSNENEKELEQLHSDAAESSSENNPVLNQAGSVEAQAAGDKDDPDISGRDDAKAFPMRFAGFWMRFWAYLLDLIVIGSIDRLLINPIFRALDIPLSDSSIFAPITIATAVTFYLYFVLMTKFFGQTLGKMAFGLRVVGLNGKKLSWATVIFREWIGRFISSSIFILYVIVAFLPKKQGLHDIFSDTSVIHER